MKRALKYTVIICAAIALCAMISASILAGKAQRAPLKCTGLDVVITDSLVNDFVSAADVKKFIGKEYGEYIGVNLDSLDLAEIERIVDGRSAVMKSQAYVTKDGILHVSVTQRKPVVRFQKPEGGFYADADGFVFPLQSSYASHVHIVDGEVPINMKSGHKGMIENPKEKEWFEKVMNVVNFIEGSKVWKDRIVQIHVDNGGELILIPREGKERFNIGQPVNIKDKFDMMATYYTAIAANREGQAYRTVTLKYDGQIVCR